MSCITIEDGTIIPDSNSYITIDQAKQLLGEIGEEFEDLPDLTLTNNLLKAMRYLESFRLKYQGGKVSGDQSLQFPRYSVKIDGYSIPSNTIPKELKMSQAVSAMYISQGYDLQEISDNRTTLSETVGPISVTYANDGPNVVTTFPLIDTYLKPLLKSGLSSSLKVVRNF